MGMVELCTKESEEVPTDKGAINAMKVLRHYCESKDCISCVFHPAGHNHRCTISYTHPFCFVTGEEAE
jgi:hypothetical protein